VHVHDTHIHNGLAYCKWRQIDLLSSPMLYCYSFSIAEKTQIQKVGASPPIQKLPVISAFIINNPQLTDTERFNIAKQESIRR